jgi:hypothetical protein
MRIIDCSIRRWWRCRTDKREVQRRNSHARVFDDPAPASATANPTHDPRHVEAPQHITIEM